MLVFFALLVVHFQSPLIIIGSFKTVKLTFFLCRPHLYSPRFLQMEDTDRALVSECCEGAYKVHIADLLLKSPRSHAHNLRLRYLCGAYVLPRETVLLCRVCVGDTGGKPPSTDV